MKKYLKHALIIAASLFGLSIFSVLFYRFVPVYFTPLMIFKAVGDGYGINHTWVPLEKISKNMQKAVVRSEDAKFYIHHGFDFEAIKKAQEYNKKHKKMKGASTISQQTAKNVFLWPSRTYIRKGLEAYFTVLMEFMWPKDRIMEVYLNIIELGPGVYGVEAASKKFFKKSASKISMSEAALLTAVLPNPIKFKVDKPSAYILKRQSRIIGRINRPVEIAPIDDEFFDDKLDEDTEETTVAEPSLESKTEVPPNLETN